MDWLLLVRHGEAEHHTKGLTGGWTDLPLTDTGREQLRQLGLRLMDSVSPIQPHLIGGNAAALTASALLRAQGFLVGAIRPPTVPVGTARLRVTLTAAHTELQVDDLLDALSGLAEGQGAPVRYTS